MPAQGHQGIVEFEGLKINFREALIMYACQRDVALSLIKSRYSVCHYDYENVTASQYWFAFYRLEFSRLFPFLMISISMKGILSSTGSSMVNVRVGCRPFRVVRNIVAASVFGIFARVSSTSLLYRIGIKPSRVCLRGGT